IFDTLCISDGSSISFNCFIAFSWNIYLCSGIRWNANFPLERFVIFLPITHNQPVYRIITCIDIVYYMYQSEWISNAVLHIFPHWNWSDGEVVDVWAYYNNADEVELFLNGESLGSKTKQGDDLHVSWRVPFKPGTLYAVSRSDGEVVLEKEIRTAGSPAKIQLISDKKELKADGNDLIFVTVNILDDKNILVPKADNLVQFEITGGGKIVGVDNG